MLHTTANHRQRRLLPMGNFILLRAVKLANYLAYTCDQLGGLQGCYVCFNYCTKCSSNVPALTFKPCVPTG